MDKVKVSVCIAYYNRSEYAEECIRSMLEQSYADLEVIVVNDGSPDHKTQEVLESIEDQRLTVIYQENTGFVGAIKAAINEAKGEYIAIQGAGDISFSKRIEAQANILDTKPNVGIVSCFFENVVFGGPQHGSRKKRPYKNTKITVNDFLAGLNPIGHGEVMFRRSVYEKAGGYRDFFRFSQDIDLWLRMTDFCEVHMIEDYLYERRIFSKDGVSADIKKLFLQKYLAEFARQNYWERNKNGKDLIEQYGIQAGLFRKPSKELSRYSSIRGLRSLRDNQKSDAEFYYEMAMREPLTKAKFIFITINKIERIPVLRLVTKLFLRKANLN